MGYKSGGQRIHESDFNDVLDLLASAPPPWKEFIGPNLKSTRSSSRSFKVLPPAKYQEKTGAGLNEPGWTNKKTGEILMLEWGQKEHTYLLAAVHECVHLVSDPPNQGAAPSTAHKKLGIGLTEGLVECVAEDILTSQNIGLPAMDMRGYGDRVPLLRSLIDPEPAGTKNKNLALFAQVLFKGNDTQLSQAMEFAFGKAGWTNIKNTASHPDLANRIIEESRKQEQDKRNAATK